MTTTTKIDATPRIIAAFRRAQPGWESSIYWDDEDRAVERIEARADKLADAVEGQFPDQPIAFITDLAIDYVCKEEA